MRKGTGLSMTSEYGIKRIRANNVSRGMKEIFCFSRRLDYSFPGMEKAAITRGVLKSCRATKTNIVCEIFS
jgi:hypothetical protein